jgi:general secretion pathway protein G
MVWEQVLRITVFEIVSTRSFLLLTLWPVSAHATFYTTTDLLIPFVGLPLVVWFIVVFLSKAINANRWMVFVSVLAIYAMVLVSVEVLSSPHKGERQKRAQMEISKLSSALEMYRIDNDTYPSTDQGLAALSDVYLATTPKDPWGRDYYYRSPGYSGDFDLYTLGRDRLPGGEGESSDIGNWMLAR